jgi:hypothetical protein
MKWFAALLLLVIAQIVQAADPVPIGRIFFTPEQRSQLDLLRTQKVVATQVRDEPVPENVTYNGIVRRSDGKTTVWVNNEAMTDAELRVKQSIVGRVDRNGQILLQTPQASGAAQLQLKVGQSAELLSGKIDEAYATQRATPVAKAKPAATEKPAAADPGAAAARPQGGGDAGTTAPADNKGQQAARP